MGYLLYVPRLAHVHVKHAHGGEVFLPAELVDADLACDTVERRVEGAVRVSGGRSRGAERAGGAGPPDWGSSLPGIMCVINGIQRTHLRSQTGSLRSWGGRALPRRCNG